MFDGAHMRLVGLLVAATCFVSGGCEKLREWAPELQRNATTAAGNKPAKRTNVIPTRKPPRRFVLQVQDERSLGYIARELGVTVADLISANDLANNELQPGQQLHVEVSPADFSRYMSKRAARIAQREARARAKVQAAKDLQEKKLQERQLRAERSRIAKQKRAGKRRASRTKKRSRRASK